MLKICLINVFLSFNMLSISVYIASNIFQTCDEYQEEIHEENEDFKSLSNHALSRFKSTRYETTHNANDGQIGRVHDIAINNNIPALQTEKQYLCKNWAVVSAVSKPTSAVRLIASDHKWCLVIVSEIKSLSRDYYLELLTYTHGRTVFLNASEQDSLFADLSITIPWGHIGRKNVGYIFAIKNGAELIWDFDYNNKGILDIDNLMNQNILRVLHRCTGQSKVFNPFPYFGVNEAFIWPRGFPPKFARKSSATPGLCFRAISVNNVGVIQSVANIEPDVDAMFKLTRTFPLIFEATQLFPFILVPRYSYCPFNKRATLWTKQAFLYMALPISVHSLVSDIWRSYIAELFFHRNGINLVFSPPFVVQMGNDRNLLEDFQAENVLYQKGELLINFLHSYQFQTNTTLENLYEELFIRNFIEIEDLYFIRIWTKLHRKYSC